MIVMITGHPATQWLTIASPTGHEDQRFAVNEFAPQVAHSPEVDQHGNTHDQEYWTDELGEKK